MNASQYFRPTYAAAREAFRTAAAARGLKVESHRNPTEGAEGEELTTDVALLGPADARRLMIVVSGTHGAEGFCGSGIQVGWLAADQPLPADTAILFVHALNPYGFSHVRRVTEDNVDLNRNFVDHGNAKPANPGYDALRDFDLPEGMDRGERAAQPGRRSVPTPRSTGRTRWRPRSHPASMSMRRACSMAARSRPGPTARCAPS